MKLRIYIYIYVYNRLPVPCQNATLSRLRITLIQLHFSLPFLFYYLPRVYIDALELHLQSSRSFNSHTAKLTRYIPICPLLLLISFLAPPLTYVPTITILGLATTILLPLLKKLADRLQLYTLKRLQSK